MVGVWEVPLRCFSNVNIKDVRMEAVSPACVCICFTWLSVAQEVRVTGLKIAPALALLHVLESILLLERSDFLLVAKVFFLCHGIYMTVGNVSPLYALKV